jgi:hypothetical protein
MIDEEGRLRRIDIDGVIYYDSILGIAGTTYPIGTREMPSNTIADVITMCATYNIRHINVRGTLVLGAAMSAYRFEGYKHLDISHTINLGGQDVSVSSFHRLVITGAQAGAGLASFDDCVLLAITGFNGTATQCGLTTTLGLAAGTLSQFIDCFSYLGTCTITLGTPNPANFVNLTGSVILEGQTAGVTNIWAANNCEIVINVGCNGGTINIYGSAIVTDNSAGGCTVNNYTLNMVPAADAATNTQMRDVIGNKTDTALTAYTAADSMVRYIKGLMDITGIRVIQSGVKAINAGITKYLHIDSGTNGAEIISIAISGINGHDWTLDIYVPASDGAGATQADDKRDTIIYAAADTEGGLLRPFGIPFDCYLDFTNDGANDQIDEVTITYRSRGALTLTWEA